MKLIVCAAAMLVGSTAAGMAHVPSHVYIAPMAVPAYSATSNWRYGLGNFRLGPSHSGAGQTLTGGPSGGPNQS